MRTDIINQLITDNNYQSYLEIGVYDKINFNAVKCRNKTGVDPEPKVRASHVMTSDDFFASNKKKFDIIFIDGLHHAEQVRRDIENGLKYLSPNGSIVVHDCNPTTEEMQHVPRIQGEWTGDVWKAWCKLRSRTDLKMFVYDCDYGVGVIQKGHQDRVRIPNNATFNEFKINRKEWLNLIPYELPPVSICIPTFEQYGFGVKSLTCLLNSLINQKGVFEILVSDNSDNQDIENLCKLYPVRYLHNPDKGISANTNNAIKNAKYDLIKIMYMDDIALSDTMAQDFARALTHSHWAISNAMAIDAYGIQTRVINSQYTEGIIKGKNTIGMPSVIGFRKNGICFDRNLKTLLDCEFYWLLNKKYGLPAKINKPLIGLRYWDGSTSRQQGNFTETEYKYLQDKWPELR